MQRPANESAFLLCWKSISFFLICTRIRLRTRAVLPSTLYLAAARQDWQNGKDGKKKSSIPDHQITLPLLVFKVIGHLVPSYGSEILSAFKLERPPGSFMGDPVKTGVGRSLDRNTGFTRRSVGRRHRGGILKIGEFIDTGAFGHIILY